MSNNPQSWLYALMAGVKKITQGGNVVPVPLTSPLTVPDTLNVIGGSVDYNSSTNAYDLTVSNGSGSEVISPLLFTQLSTATPPASGHGFITLEGYVTQGDAGNGKIAIWVATSTATPVNYSIAQVTGTSVGRWIILSKTIDITDYGAVGNGLPTSASANTTAINAAIAAYEAANAAGVGGYVMYAPAGTYCFVAPLTWTGVIGGIFRGDGPGATILQAYSVGYNNTGVQGVLVRKNCQYFDIRDMTVSQGDYQSEISSPGIAQGATGCTITGGAVASITAGMRVTLAKTNATAAEVISIVSNTGGVLVFSTPTLYAYATNDWVLAGCLAGVVDYTDGTAVSTHNSCHNVQVGSASDAQLGAGFATDCLGGGPTYVTSPVTGGAGATVTVYDASRFVPGVAVQFWTNTSTPAGSYTVSSRNLATNVITMTATIAESYSDGAILVSKADVNNDEHVYDNCTAVNCMQASWLIIGWNSVNLKLQNFTMSQSFAGISARTGGGFTCAFGTWEDVGIDIEYGGPMTHASRIVGGVTETGSQLLVMHSVDKAQAVILRYYSYDKHGGPTTPAKLIDVTCNNVSLDFYGCGLVSGASAGLSMSITDSSNGGYVTFAGQCYSGMNAYTLTGVTFDDQGTVWDLGYPTETLTNSYVTARNAQYSTPGLNGGTSRVAKRTVTLSGSVPNPDIPTYGDATLYATVASGTVTIDGFIAGIEGYRIRLIVEGFVAVNVLNNSASETTAANKILTPTGGTLNLNSTGTNAYTVMDFAYDSASARWRFMP